jgi:membrane associated rhomboid family serine protease
MADRDARINARTLALLVLLVVGAAVVITLLQTLILGRANIAITGAIVGAMAGVMATRLVRKRQG